MKQKLFKTVEGYLPQLKALSDDIFDHPEIGFEEEYAADLLCGYLEKAGFKVERGIADLPTAFRAEYEYGTGGPVIGFLGEYDALADLGHGCGHHLQTPAAIGAALAIKDNYTDTHYKLVIYGTPAEETRGGKINMANAGCFRELDMVFSNHTGNITAGANNHVALASSVIEWTGINSHAGGSPEKGRSALDAMALCFHGLECMREHVRTGSRIHYTILEGTGAANIVHPKARARVTCRCNDKNYLEDMLRRMRKVAEGSAMMTETEVEVRHDPMFFDTVLNVALHNAVEKNAELLDVKKLVRKTEAELSNTGGGATDYGNVSYMCPGVMFNVEYGNNVVAHTPEYVALGTTEEASNYLKNCACIMAGVSYDFLTDEAFRKEVKEEYLRRLSEKGAEA